MKSKFKLKCSVTVEDIATGVPQDCYGCPIAQAIGRAARAQGINCRNPSMGIRVASLSLREVDGLYVWNVPEGISRRVRQFDQYKEMAPFEFTAEFALS